MKREDNIKRCEDISVRLRNLCIMWEIETVGQLVDFYLEKEKDGLDIRNIGKKTLEELKDIVNKVQESKPQDNKEGVKVLSDTISAMIEMSIKTNAAKTSLKFDHGKYPDWDIEISARKKGTITSSDMPDFVQILKLIDKWKDTPSSHSKEYEDVYEYLEKNYKPKMD